MAKRNIVGVDIGGTGIKMGLVDTKKDKLLSERFKELTPKPSTPDAVAEKVLSMKKKYFPDYKGPVGVGFPSIIKNGVAKTAANIDDAWKDVNIEKLLSKKLQCEVKVANDADVAGIAEMNTTSIKKHRDGTTIFLTVGTGIGSALFYNGHLVPNTEFGHLLYNGDIYEKYAANSAREREELSWPEWASRFNQYLNHLELLFSPNQFILGGGIAKKKKKYYSYLNTDADIYIAELKNAAGVIGAADLINEA